MPRFRTNYTTAKPRAAMPPGFFETRDAFRMAGLELFREGAIRIVAVNGGVTFGVFRTVDRAAAWLKANPTPTAVARTAR